MRVNPSRLRFIFESSRKTRLQSFSLFPTASILPSHIEPPTTQLLNASRPTLVLNFTTRCYSGYAAEQFSDDEYDCDYDNHPQLLPAASGHPPHFIKNHISIPNLRFPSAFLYMMNISEVYGKVVVVSKVPLPNYRPDLDDKRPQREVVIPLGLQRRVEALLQEHLDRLQLNSTLGNDSSNESKSDDQVQDNNPDKNTDSLLDGSVMEKVLQRRSMRMRNMQRAWQANGQVEVTNRTIINGIKKRLTGAKGNWIHELPSVLWAYRTAEASATGEIPYSLVYGVEAVIPAEVEIKTVRTTDLLISEQLQKENNEENLRLDLDLLEEKRMKASLHEAKVKEKMKLYHNRRVRKVQFVPGDLFSKTSL